MLYVQAIICPCHKRNLSWNNGYGPLRHVMLAILLTSTFWDRNVHPQHFLIPFATRLSKAWCSCRPAATGCYFPRSKVSLARNSPRTVGHGLAQAEAEQPSSVPEGFTYCYVFKARTSIASFRSTVQETNYFLFLHHHHPCGRWDGCSGATFLEGCTMLQSLFPSFLFTINSHCRKMDRSSCE